MSLGFVFPGQGAQAVGMGGDFLDSDAVVRARFEEANAALGFDLVSIVLEGPPERLAETEVTQPALLTVGVALWDAWCARGGARPTLLAGHSLGEYTALAAAGALAFEDAVRLVHARGRFMQERPFRSGRAPWRPFSGSTTTLLRVAAQGQMASWRQRT